VSLLPLSLLSHYNTKTAIVVAEVREVVAAVGGTEVDEVEPRAPAQDPPGLVISGKPRRAVGWRTLVVVVPMILDPLPDIAVNIIEA